MTDSDKQTTVLPSGNNYYAYGKNVEIVDSIKHTSLLQPNKFYSTEHQHPSLIFAVKLYISNWVGSNLARKYQTRMGVIE